MPQFKPALQLGQDPVRQCFYHFLMPAITGMIIKSLYIVADVMFIGHTMGEDGLAAINIVLPYFSFMFAIANTGSNTRAGTCIEIIIKSP